MKSKTVLSVFRLADQAGNFNSLGGRLASAWAILLLSYFTNHACCVFHILQLAGTPVWITTVECK